MITLYHGSSSIIENQDLTFVIHIMTLEKNFTEEGLELANGDFMVSGCSGIELAHYVLEDQNLDREILRDFISSNTIKEY